EALQRGARRARAEARPFLERLRHAVGLRPLVAMAGEAPAATAEKADPPALATFKQYRESDGKFYFKLVAADGRLLLQSTGFEAPRDAGQAIARLQREGGAALAPLAG